MGGTLINQNETMTTKPNSKVKIIKRYQNRKLYDTQQSCYVTLDDIAKMIRTNEEVMVIDNNDYISALYGNKQTLLATVGRKVNAGVVVSTVGSSGGIPEAGLYFELRHKGLAFDPLKWISSGAK